MLAFISISTSRILDCKLRLSPWLKACSWKRVRRSEGENDLKYHIENGGGWNRTFCNYWCFNFSKLGMSVLQEMDINTWYWWCKPRQSDWQSSWAIYNPSDKHLVSSGGIKKVVFGQLWESEKASKQSKIHQISGANPFRVFKGVFDVPDLPPGVLGLFFQWIIRFGSLPESIFNKPPRAMNIVRPSRAPTFIM